MTRELAKTSAASIRAKLLALAQASGEDYQRVLGRFAISVLYRLGNSPHRERFVLKGATLFTLWTGKSHRPTKDLDLLGSGLPQSTTWNKVSERSAGLRMMMAFYSMASRSKASGFRKTMSTMEFA